MRIGELTDGQIKGYEVKGTRRDTLINKNDKPIMRF